MTFKPCCKRYEGEEVGAALNIEHLFLYIQNKPIKDSGIFRKQTATEAVKESFGLRVKQLPDI